MLAVYGTMMPLRLLEEIVFWKRQEMEHTDVIRAIVPGLEPAYATLLQDWENVFARTLEQAQTAMRAALAQPGSALPPEWRTRLPKLLDDSLCESREFVRQLHLLQQQSFAVRQTPIAPTVLAHIRRESEGVMEEWHRTGQPAWLTGSSRAEENKETSEGYDGPEPADAVMRQEGAVMRPEGTWSDPLGEAAAGGSGGKPVPIGGHKLPPLPYPYQALEPWIDEKTMRIHHDKHHQSYVDGLNHAERKLEESRKTGQFDLVKHWERELAFHGAGHYLHTIFWEAMSPRGGGAPSGALAGEIDRSFGGFEPFKKQFSEAAVRVEGNGWAILVWCPRSHRLEILTAEKHQNLSQWDVIPLLPLDVWEHAYYLKRQNDRAAYVRDWWNTVNWPYVAERYAKAKTLRWAPY